MPAMPQVFQQHFVSDTSMSRETLTGRLRVLIVDDHGPSAQTLAKLLELWGFDAYVCQDGREAVKCAEACRPDALLLDIMLPRIDGLQLARHFREDDTLQHVTLIAITGLGDAAHRAQAREAGFAHHLLKPLIHAELQAILKALERSKTGS